MIKAEQIPPEAWDKICEAFDVKPSEARAALAAALNAWEGMHIPLTTITDMDTGAEEHLYQIVLPLTKNPNDKG